VSDPSGEGEWYACHTRPRREKKFAALMAAEGFENYLPLVDSIRRYPSGTKRFTKPLFPGYVFARVPAARKARIYQQELIARAIQVDDVPRFLSQLEDVRKIVASGVELSLIPFLTRGRRVRVIGGPLHGLEGLVDDSSNPQGIVISVDVLRQGLLLKVPAESLRALP
jgi:transcription antitermination factor NusG